MATSPTSQLKMRTSNLSHPSISIEFMGVTRAHLFEVRMMASSTLAEVVARFSEESGKIGEFMFSLKGHSCFRRRELDLFNSALKDTDIAAVSVPKKTHPEQLLSLEET